MALQRRSGIGLQSQKWDRIRTRVRHVTVELTLLSFIVLIWVASFRLTLNADLPSIETGDLLTLLFGAASVALFAISFIVALLAVVGWQGVNDLIRERTTAAIKEESDRAYQELTGRLYSGLGLVFGRVARPTDQLRASRPDLLEVAIDFSRDAFNSLDRLDSDYKTAALNNLIFYLAVRNRQEDAQFALHGANELRESAVRHERRAYTLTYCRVALEFSEDPSLQERIRRMLREIRDDLSSSQVEREEADLYLREFFSEPRTTGPVGGEVRSWSRRP